MPRLTAIVLCLTALCSTRAQPLIEASAPRVFSDPRTPPIFSVSAAGAAPVSYQWYRGQPGDTSAPVVDATSATYSPSASARSLEVYWVRASDSGGDADSAPYSIARTGTRLAAAANHSFYLGSDGSAWAYGSNTYGQLGDGSTTDRSAPAKVMTGVAAIATGDGHSLFLRFDGSVWVTGANGSGQLGDGSTTNRSTPVQLTTDVAAIAAGGGYGFFLKSDGSAWAVGANSHGQLGDGTTTNRSTPVQVMGGVAAIAAGREHGFFLKTDGSLWAVGGNDDGELGVGSTMNRSTPVQVMTGVAAVSAGGNHSLFLKSDGSAWACGFNGTGQLGDGSTSRRTTPVPIMGGVAALSAGDFHSLFLKSDGSAWTAGYNRHGQLGDGATAYRTRPVQIMTGIVALSAGGNHSFFLKPDDSLWAAGHNYHGQLGDGSLTDRWAPASVLFPGPRVFSNPRTPPVFTVAATSASAAYQWYRGRPGDISTPIPGANAPAYAPPASSASLEVFWARARYQNSDADSAAFSIVREDTRVAAGGGHSLFRTSNGSVWACGYGTLGQLGDGSVIDRSTPVQLLLNAGAIAAGGSHSLFLGYDGSAWAAGRNGSGQLGDGTTTDRSTPVHVMTGVASLSAGASHSLFIQSDGSAWAAGYNYFSQLGDGSATDRPTPVHIMNGVASVSAGFEHSLFLKSDGSAWATGRNNFGQLGNGSPSGLWIPERILTGVTAVSAGGSAHGSHSLFLKSDGSVWATGSNTFGQLGDSAIANRTRPVRTMVGVVAISAGDNHSLFLKSDGSLWVAGDYHGREPTQITTDVTALSAGAGHSLFRKSDGSVWGVGNNYNGQLGNGLVTSGTTPVAVLLPNNQSPQTIAFPNPGPHQSGDAPFTLAPTASSGLPVALEIMSGPATVFGHTVRLTGIGTVLLRATQPGDADHLAATPIDQSFEVLPSWPADTHADTDADGLPGLLEYALGSAPSSPDASPVNIAHDGAHLRLTFPRVADPALIYAVEATNAPDDVWTTIWTSTGAENTAGPVTVADDIELSPANPHRFLRLRVTAP